MAPLQTKESMLHACLCEECVKFVPLAPKEFNVSFHSIPASLKLPFLIWSALLVLSEGSGRS